MDSSINSFTIVLSVVFGLVVISGSFVATSALTPLNSDQMRDVHGQEGIEFDLHLGSSFQIDEIDWTDGDGAPSASGNAGTVGFHAISPTGSLTLEGVTVDADDSVTVGGTTQSAIVIGIPSLSNGLTIGAIDPGGGDPNTISPTPEGNSIAP